jgi:hypothetical protein
LTTSVPATATSKGNRIIYCQANKPCNESSLAVAVAHVSDVIRLRWQLRLYGDPSRCHRPTPSAISTAGFYCSIPCLSYRCLRLGRALENTCGSMLPLKRTWALPSRCCQIFVHGQVSVPLLLCNDDASIMSTGSQDDHGDIRLTNLPTAAPGA